MIKQTIKTKKKSFEIKGREDLRIVFCKRKTFVVESKRGAKIEKFGKFSFSLTLLSLTTLIGVVPHR